MSEYNIQMNKYNALNAEYDQLYPNPMKHANTHAKDGGDPITPASIGAYTKTEADALLANKAEASTVSSHVSNKSNPHVVTAEQVGAYDKAQTDSLLNNKLSTNLGSIGGDFANLDTVKSPGDYVWLDTKAEIGIIGALYTVRVAAPKYGAFASVTQMMQRTYPASEWSIKVRSYYYASGWTPWRTLATTNDFAKIAIGSYVGTGTYSSANPNTLNFDFEPKVLIVVADGANSSYPGFVIVRGQSYSNGIGSYSNSAVGYDLRTAWAGNSVSWYTNNTFDHGRAYAQLNAEGVTYRYIALG